MFDSLARLTVVNVPLVQNESKLFAMPLDVFLHIGSGFSNSGMVTQEDKTFPITMMLGQQIGIVRSVNIDYLGQLNSRTKAETHTEWSDDPWAKTGPAFLQS